MSPAPDPEPVVLQEGTFAAPTGAIGPVYCECGGPIDKIFVPKTAAFIELRWRCARPSCGRIWQSAVAEIFESSLGPVPEHVSDAMRAEGTA